MLEAYPPSSSGLIISHLLFANDFLLVVKSIVRNAIYLKALIEAYRDISGQAINMKKSRITLPINKDKNQGLDQIFILDALQVWNLDLFGGAHIRYAFEEDRFYFYFG